ncbi:hypothetical protein BDW67DRAFT_171328 [Aspergillus spinulosporus]
MAQACEKCRVLKVKCVRIEPGKPCTKCTKAKTQCIVPEPKQPARQRQRRPRLVDLETKITDLLGLLSQTTAAPTVDGNESTEGPERAVSTVCTANQAHDDMGGGWLDQGVLEELNEELNMDFVRTMDSNTGCSSAMTWATPTSADSSWVADLGLNLVVLEHLLDGFRSLAHYFPFVVIPADWTVTYMAEDRPFLLLSAVACASSRSSNLQHALAEELKETFSHRVVIAGEKDLDLLQGLLVHLAWFHFYLDPRSRQTYQYLQMAISMVVELDLEQKIADLIEGPTEPGGLCSREACRAYLGCYYLSSLIATATSKPENFHCSEHVLRCTRMLQHDQEFPTDELICPLIRLQQLTREVCDTYQLGVSQINASRPERFSARLEEWWTSLPPDSRCAVILSSGYHAVKIRIFEMGLVYRYGQRRRPPTNLPGDSISSASSKVTVNLTKCLICAKELFDTFMAIPEGEHAKLPLSLWYQLILAIIVLYRLSIGLPEIPDWSSEVAQDSVNLPECLDMLTYRLRSSEPKRRAESQASNDNCLFTMFPDMVESVRASFISASKYPTPNNACEVSAHPSFVGSNSAPSTQRHRCPAMRNLRRPAGESTMEDARLQRCIAEEIQNIENEKFLNDLLVTDTCSI